VNDDGERLWGVHTFAEMPAIRVASLELYVGHPAVDLEKLVIPARIVVVAGYNAAYGDANAADPSIQRIEAYLHAYNAGRSKNETPNSE
jgi:hypothetical protein